MRKKLKLLFLLLLMIGCEYKNSKEMISKNKTKLNQKLVDELEKIRKTDQIASDIARVENKKLSEEEWKRTQDSLHNINQKKLKNI